MHYICSPESIGQAGDLWLTHTLQNLCQESSLFQVDKNFLPRATHRPLPLTELNTACFRESPPADFGKVPRSVNPVILCHWHNELNTSKYHISKTQTTLESQVVLPFYTGSMSKILQPMSNTSEARVLLTPGRSQSLVNCKVSSLDTFETNLAV